MASRAFVMQINNLYTPASGQAGLTMAVAYIADDTSSQQPIMSDVEVTFGWGATGNQIQTAVASAITARGNQLGITIGTGSILGPGYQKFN